MGRGRRVCAQLKENGQLLRTRNLEGLGQIPGQLPTGFKVIYPLFLWRKKVKLQLRIQLFYSLFSSKVGK
jgi:hypothetical protein